MRKKALAMSFVVKAALLMVVLAVMIIIFVSLIGRGRDNIANPLNATGSDIDCDGVSNILDRCCATKADDREAVGFNGCKEGEERVPCSEVTVTSSCTVQKKT